MSGGEVGPIGVGQQRGQLVGPDPDQRVAQRESRRRGDVLQRRHAQHGRARGQPGRRSRPRVLHDDAPGRAGRRARPWPAGTAPGRACAPAPRRRRWSRRRGPCRGRRGWRAARCRRSAGASSSPGPRPAPAARTDTAGRRRPGRQGISAREELAVVSSTHRRRRGARPRCGSRRGRRRGCPSTSACSCRRSPGGPRPTSGRRAGRPERERLAPVLLRLDQRAVHVEQHGAQ